MDATVVQIVQTVITIAAAAVANGVIVAIVTEALKWNAIKWPATKAPRLTAWVLSIVSSAFVVWGLGVVVLNSVGGWVVFTIGTFLAATQSYDGVWKLIEELKKITK